jgi:hypothetical protein
MKKKTVTLYKPDGIPIVLTDVSSAHVDDGNGVLTIRLNGNDALTYGGRIVSNMPFFIAEES